MPRTTNCVLTEEKEIEFRDYLKQRLGSLRTDNIGRIKADCASWEAYENDASKRAGDAKSIFSKSNVHLPITAMTVDYFLGRTEDGFPEDSEPFFAFKPVGNGDRDKAAAFNRYFNWKLDTKGNASQVMRDGLTSIYVQRAAIFKCAYRKDVRKWRDAEATILWDKISRQPVLTPQSGFVIKDEDQWTEEPDAVDAEAAIAAQSVGAEPPPVGKRTFLANDPSIVWDEARYEWAPPPSALLREETLFEGAEPQMVDYDRFLCPDMAESLDSADCIAELYDKDWFWYRAMWIERPWCRWEDFQTDLAAGDASAKTAGENKSTEKLGWDDKNAKRKVVEFWVTRDVLGIGEPQNVMALYDEDSDKLIYYEFVEKICPDRKRPYISIAIGKAKKRWWGPSIPEKVAQYQDKIDRNFNAEAYRNEKSANPLTGTDETALAEEPESDNLNFGPDEIIRLRGGKKVDDYVSFATVPQVDYNTSKMADLILWFVQRWLHMSNTNMGDLAQTNGGEAQTATGEEINQEENRTMARRWNRRIFSGYEALGKKLVQLTAALMPQNQKETFQFFEGEDVLTGTMTAQDIAGIDVDVRLVIKKKFTTEVRRKSEQALAIATAYIMLPPEVRIVFRQLYVDQYQALGYNDADRVLPITDVLPPVKAPAPTAQGGAA